MPGDLFSAFRTVNSFNAFSSCLMASYERVPLCNLLHQIELRPEQAELHDKSNLWGVMNKYFLVKSDKVLYNSRRLKFNAL